MNLISLVLRPLAIAIAMLANELPLRAEPPVPVPTAAQIEGMCPELGLTGLRFGAARADQDADQLASLRHLDGRFAPFDEAEVNFTQWSGKLSSVTFRGAPAEEETKVEWQAAVVAQLESAGWREFIEDRSAASIKSRQLAKRILRPDGDRNLVIEVDVFGEYAIHCADPEMRKLYWREADGDLAEGAERPAKPVALRNLSDVIAAIDCDDPVLLDKLKGAGSLRNTGTVLEQHIGLAAGLDEEAVYEERLGTWLRWRMRNSGKITLHEMWAIEDSVAVKSPDDPALVVGLLEAFYQVSVAHSAGDPAQICVAYRGIFEAENRTSTLKAAQEGALNRRLEEEAARRGISLE